MLEQSAGSECRVIVTHSDSSDVFVYSEGRFCNKFCCHYLLPLYYYFSITVAAGELRAGSKWPRIRCARVNKMHNL